MQLAAERHTSALRVDIWSDIACPWCWIGKRRLEKAFGKHEGQSFDLVWRAFELDPNAPVHVDDDVSHVELLASKYRVPLAKAEAMVAHVTEIGRQDGLDMRFDRVQRTNTFDAHRLVHLATTKSHAQGDAMKERLFRAYMSEGANLGDAAVLVKLAREVGLDDGEAQETLATDGYAHEVRDDEELAKRHGITGVPFFVFGERYAVSGAQPAEVLAEVIGKTLGDRAQAVSADGMSCGADGCSH